MAFTVEWGVNVSAQYSPNKKMTTVMQIKLSKREVVIERSQSYIILAVIDDLSNALHLRTSWARLPKGVSNLLVRSAKLLEFSDYCFLAVIANHSLVSEKLHCKSLFLLPHRLIDA